MCVSKDELYSSVMSSYGEIKLLTIARRKSWRDVIVYIQTAMKNISYYVKLAIMADACKVLRRALRADQLILTSEHFPLSVCALCALAVMLSFWSA